MSDENRSAVEEKSRRFENFLSFIRKLRRRLATEGLTDVMDELDREEEQRIEPQP